MNHKNTSSSIGCFEVAIEINHRGEKEMSLNIYPEILLSINLCTYFFCNCKDKYNRNILCLLEERTYKLKSILVLLLTEINYMLDEEKFKCFL